MIEAGASRPPPLDHLGRWTDIATFGNATIEAGTDSDNADAKTAGKFTLSVPGSVTKLIAYAGNAQTGHAACNAKAIIYADSAGVPGARLFVGSAVAFADNAAEAWVDHPFSSPVNLSAGTYWIGVQYDATAGGCSIRRGGALGYNQWNADRYSDGASDPWGTSGPGTYRLSIYATDTQTDDPTTPLPTVTGLHISDIRGVDNTLIRLPNRGVL